MHITTFKASGVFGYLNFDLKFNRDLNYLIGCNGSGKTTVLKMINALLAPNFYELIVIPFSEIEVSIDNAGKQVKISAATHGDKIILSATGADSALELPVYSEEEINYLSAHRGGVQEVIDDVIRKTSDHPIVTQLAEFPSPIFLALDRRRPDSPKDFTEREYLFQRQRTNVAMSERGVRARRLIRGALGVSLMETELMVQRAYRKMREVEAEHSLQLRNSILLSAFQYVEFNPAEFATLRDSIAERTTLLNRRNEIKVALSKIGTSEDRLIKDVDRFFDRLTKLIQTMTPKKEEDFHVHIEWLTNKAQIDRFANIVELIDENQSRIDAVYQPITHFQETINEFYRDSGKTVSIDPVGHIQISNPNGVTASVGSLSSGERQILVIFAHALFSSNQSNVFIIDEPELSLHLNWQEKFASTIQTVSPSHQYLMATHSPEIIGDNKKKTLRCEQ